MTARIPDPPDPLWEELCRLHPGHPALEQDEIHALHPRLITAIQAEAPDLLTRNDAEFERDLADLTPSGGFFLKRHFDCPLLPLSDPPPGPRSDFERELDQRQTASDAEIRELLRSEMRPGATGADVDRQFAHDQELEDRVMARRRGYAGWLVTHPQFQFMRAYFVTKWERRIRKDGRLPRVAESLFGERPRIPKRRREYYADHWRLCCEWGLESLLTWHLPLPLRPDWAMSSLYYLPQVSAAGMLLFVPWYLLADKDLRLHDLAAHKRRQGHAQQLDEWLEPGTNWGHERYGVMFQLFVYLVLGLRSRYGDRLRRSTSKLDAAFARFLSESENTLVIDREIESVRKIRQAMDRRLRDWANSLDTLTTEESSD